MNRVALENLEIQKHGQTVCRVSHLQLGAGERLALIGANGSGKSTLLRFLAQLEMDFRGTCRIDVPVNRRVYVHQTPYLFRGTVWSNVVYGLKARGLRDSELRPTASEWLDRFGLAAHANQPSQELSGGERRRVALARAFAIRPSLLLLDEPLADLDSGGEKQLVEALASLPEATFAIASPSPLPKALCCREFHLETAR